mgnify:CR=1 FL=1
MNIHEHQAKELLAGLGVPTSTGQVAFAPEEAVEAAHNMIDKGTTLLVLKAQIHAGGRGKGVVYDPESGDARQYGDKDLRGVKVLPLDGLENPLHEVWEIANGMLAVYANRPCNAQRHLNYTDKVLYVSGKYASIDAVLSSVYHIGTGFFLNKITALFRHFVCMIIHGIAWDTVIFRHLMVSSCFAYCPISGSGISTLLLPDY